MKAKKHALLPASGAHRWLACPPSARLEEQFPQGTSSVSAAEGTFAHEYAEMTIKSFYSMISKYDYDKYLKQAKVNEYYSNDLVEYITEYIDMVISKYEDAKKRDKEAVLLIEQRLDFSEWAKEGFGTGDAVIIADGLMEICDLKYGRNIPVKAENNPQLRLYALGAYHEFSFLYDFDSIQITICQPRNGGISSELLPVRALLEWGEQVKEIAELAYEGKGELKAGGHCKFCNAAPKCRKLAELNLEIAKYDFKDCNLLSDTELTDILGRVDELVSYANKVKDYCLVEAISGKHFEGFKLVEGRSVSKFTDTDKVTETLIADGFTEDEIYKPKELLGMTALKKVVGTKHFTELLSGLLVKPQGKPTLVPASDKRPEFNSAELDFDEIPNF